MNIQNMGTCEPVLSDCHFNLSIFPGSFNGSLSSLPAHELGSIAIREALKRAGVKGDEVSEVILGQVLVAGRLV